MKLGSANSSGTDRPTAHAARKSGAWHRLGAELEDTVSVSELEDTWERVRADAERLLPIGWQSELQQVYLDHKSALISLNGKE